MKRREFVKACGVGATGMVLPGLAWAEGISENDQWSPARLKQLSQVDQLNKSGPFQAAWESLSNYSAPDWYKDAKFGIFIHWGVYSVPAYLSEWYPHFMYIRSNPVYWHHRRVWGPQDKFGYKDFIPMFKAEKFDAGAWIDLFKAAGAKYVVPVAEHHDGFAMYNCGFSGWTATKMGPKRDVIGELAQAARAKGMTFGLSSHRAEHWWFMNGGRKFKSDVQSGKYESFYGPAQPEKTPPNEAHMKDWLARCTELVDLYQPQIFWFDWWIEQPAFEPYRKNFAAYYYNRARQWGKEVVLNYKNKAYPEKAAVLDMERSGQASIRPLVWQTDTSVSYISWGYIKGDKFKSPSRLIKELVDIVSKNGVLLLNVGPKPDGTIPEEAQNIFKDMGKWLSINGEAVYGTRPWKIFGEGPTALGQNKAFGAGELAEPELTARDIRFTSKGNAVYAVVMGWPDDRKVTIKSLGKKAGLLDGEIKGVGLLGSGAKIQFSRDDDALRVSLPEQKPCDYAITIKIIVES